jgi:putative endonuclease
MGAVELLAQEKNWVVYLVRCADDSLYCGISSDLEKRLECHNRGTGAKYTRSRRPVKLLAASTGMSKSDALKLEHRIKKTPAGRKLSVLEIAGRGIFEGESPVRTGPASG